MARKPLEKNPCCLVSMGKKLHAIVMGLNEQEQESISGGAKEKFERTKPHMNIGTIGSSSSSPYEGCDPGTCC